MHFPRQIETLWLRRPKFLCFSNVSSDPDTENTAVSIQLLLLESVLEYTIVNEEANWKNKLLGIQQLSQMPLKCLDSRSGSPHNNVKQCYGMTSRLFNSYGECRGRSVY